MTCAAALAAAIVFLGMPLATSGSAEAAARVVRLSDENRVGKLQVVLGNSETVRISLPFSEIVVGDPEIADVNPLTDKTLYVLGRRLGTTNVTLFDENKQLVAVIDILEGVDGAVRPVDQGAFDQWPRVARRPGGQCACRREGHDHCPRFCRRPGHKFHVNRCQPAGEP